MASPLISQTILIAFGIFLLTIQTPTWSSLSEGLGFLMIIGGLIISLTRQLQTNESATMNWQAIHWCALAILIYMIASLFWSSVPYDSILIFKNYAILFVIITCGSLIYRPIIKLDLFFYIIILSGFLLSIYALFQLIVDTSLYPGLTNGSFTNPNSLAVYLGICLLISLHLLLQKNNISHIKWIYILVIITILSAFILTHSRTAYIAITISFFSLAYFQKNQIKTNKKENIFNFLFVITGVMVTLSFMTNAPEKIQAFNMAATIHTGTLPTRFDMWASSIDAALSTNPIFGNGIGTFKSVYPHFRPEFDNTSGLHAHNDLIHVFVELGSLSLCFLFIFLIIISKKIYKYLVSTDDEPTKGVTIVILFYCAISSVMTPVILLAPVMVIISIILIPLTHSMGTTAKHQAHYKTILNVAIVGLILFGALCAQNAFSQKMMSQVRYDLRTGDMESFLKTIEIADIASLGLNSHIFILKTSAILAMDQQNMLGNALKETVLNEARFYLSKAQQKNPYNTENYYYQSLIYEQSGDKLKAIEMLKKTLDITPEYGAARLKFFELNHRDDNAYNVLKDGLNYHYWKTNPQNLYLRILEEAIKRNDTFTRSIVQKKLQGQ